MHQIHNNNRHLDEGYKGLDHVSVKRFGRSCVKKPLLFGHQRTAVREPQLIIIRNKYTKEVVDLEVSFACFIYCEFRVLQTLI